MIVRRLARPLLASVFVAAGVEALRHPAARTDQAAHLLQKVPDQVPGAEVAAKDPDLFVRVNGAALLGGGLLLATGRMPRLASTVLAASIVPTTAIEHAFWEEPDPTRKAQSRSLFLKNVGLLGGLLLAAVDTEGRPGLAWRAQHATKTTRREARHAQRAAKREARLLAHRAQDVVS
ncbi:DoxX family membrane protein [Terrabacter sp. LjRoot27]|uniref:DoxX family membrane protein n=1 Tax=Terrabacter sp. LjRoot27 TaxID=3342306 RepID=UPI003ED04DF2